MEKYEFDAKLESLGVKEHFYANSKRDLILQYGFEMAVSSAFTWETTPEGFKFWYGIIYGGNTEQSQRLEPLPDEYYEYLSNL